MSTMTASSGSGPGRTHIGQASSTLDGQRSHKQNHGHHHSHKQAPHPPTAAVLEPPWGFAAVEQNVYRFSSLDLTPESFAFLRSLRLKKILLLSPERPAKTLVAFAREHNVELAHYGLAVESNGSSAADPLSPFVSAVALSNSIISEKTISKALDEVLNVDNHPIAVCDLSGMQESGVLFGCLRRLQGWNFSSILVEYRSFAGSRRRAAHERFIETFGTDRH